MFALELQATFTGATFLFRRPAPCSRVIAQTFSGPVFIGVSAGETDATGGFSGWAECSWQPPLPIKYLVGACDSLEDELHARLENRGKTVEAGAVEVDKAARHS